MEIKTATLMGLYSGKDSGWGNGYIAVPQLHPLFEMEYHDVMYYLEEWCERHGQELTYGEARNPKTGKDDGYWWLGFDTAHSWNTPRDDFEYVVSATLGLANVAYMTNTKK